MAVGLSLSLIWCLLTDARGRLVGVRVDERWSVLGTQRLQLGSCEFFSQGSGKSRGERSGEESQGPWAPFGRLRLWVAKVLQSTIRVLGSPALSQRKGIPQGLEGPSQSPHGHERVEQQWAGVTWPLDNVSTPATRKMLLLAHVVSF